MELLNYSSFTNVIYKNMTKKNMTKICHDFLDFILNDPFYVVRDNGEPYQINPRLAGEWFRGETDIYENIKKAAARQDIIDSAPDYLCGVYEALIDSYHQDQTIEDLHDLVRKDASIPQDVRAQLEQNYEDKDNYEFISRAFLYALTVQNNQNHVMRSAKTGNRISLDDLISGLKGTIAKLPRPLVIVPPDELDETEMTYVNALLEAYSDDKNVIIASREEPKSYPDYEKNFARQRKYYYAAEGLRESVRDTFEEKDYQAFDELKEEVYDGAIETIEQPCSSGYDRLSKTLSHVTMISLGSLLAQIPGWIKQEQKKGLCHMLVNDGRFEWVKKDE